jgi:hypothetical protein
VLSVAELCFLQFGCASGQFETTVRHRLARERSASPWKREGQWMIAHHQLVAAVIGDQ